MIICPIVISIIMVLINDRTYQSPVALAWALIPMWVMCLIVFLSDMGVIFHV